MGYDEESLIRLWREKRGEIEPEDFSDNLIVQLGTVTEVLNRGLYQRSSGQTIKDIQERGTRSSTTSGALPATRATPWSSTPSESAAAAWSAVAAGWS
jgi:hypothetical protein